MCGWFVFVPEVCVVGLFCTEVSIVWIYNPSTGVVLTQYVTLSEQFQNTIEKSLERGKLIPFITYKYMTALFSGLVQAYQ
jgi:hypothetical protein